VDRVAINVVLRFLKKMTRLGFVAETFAELWVQNFPGAAVDEPNAGWAGPDVGLFRRP
jgi:hypothetical protein